jgi:hypothetical protein
MLFTYLSNLVSLEHKQKKGKNKMTKYKNNTISKEYRKLLKKITFNWCSYNGTDSLEKKLYLVFYLNNESKEWVDAATRATILKQNYYY